MRAKTDKNKTNFLSPFLPLFHLLLFLLFRLLVKRHQGSSARASLCWWETAPRLHMSLVWLQIWWCCFRLHRACTADSTRNGPWLTWDRLLSRDLPSNGETDVRKLVFTRKVTNNKNKNKHLQLDRIKVVMMRKRMRLPMKHFSFPN